MDVEEWEAFSAQVLRGGSCGIAEKKGARIQSKGSCNASAQARGSCFKNGRVRAMDVIKKGISEPISYIGSDRISGLNRISGMTDRDFACTQFPRN